MIILQECVASIRQNHELLYPAVLYQHGWTLLAYWETGKHDGSCGSIIFVPVPYTCGVGRACTWVSTNFRVSELIGCIMEANPEGCTSIYLITCNYRWRLDMYPPYNVVMTHILWMFFFFIWRVFSTLYAVCISQRLSNPELNKIWQEVIITITCHIHTLVFSTKLRVIRHTFCYLKTRRSVSTVSYRGNLR